MNDFFDRDDKSTGWSAAERRQYDRQHAFKSAEIIFGADSQVHKGIVLDESPDGVLIDLGKKIDVPSAVIFRYSNGPLVYAINCWNAKTEIGLHFIENEPATQGMVKPKDVLNILEMQGPAAAFRMLRDMRFLDNHNLQKAAEEALAANLRLKTALSLIR